MPVTVAPALVPILALKSCSQIGMLCCITPYSLVCRAGLEAARFTPVVSLELHIVCCFLLYAV